MRREGAATPDDLIATRKRLAAEKGVQFIESGMVIGLGHGSTAAFAIRKIAALLQGGELTDIVAVPCSNEAAAMAEALGIPLTTLEAHPHVDVTIDGADEVDPDMNLIKGGGGALLREKIVARASRREIIVVDESKLSRQLGIRFALPVEVAPSTETAEAEYLVSLGADVTRRGGEPPFVTDGGNHILDCSWPGIENANALAQQLNERPGIADHGLFLGLATDLIVAGDSGIHHFARGQDWTAVIVP
ncbi:MAG: ribose-5-phosphate isomerase RpiA [Candidatus Bipolaricaulia bacterium]